MQALDGLVKRLLYLACGTSNPKREILLQIASEITGKESILIFWAYDENQNHYLLANFLDPDELITSKKELQSVIAIPVRSTVGIGFPTFIRHVSTALKRPLSRELLIEVKLNDTNEPPEEFARTHIGYLQILSEREIPSSSFEGLDCVAQSLASSVSVWRNRRKRLALQKLQESLIGESSSENWIQTCVELLQEITQAKICVAFRASRDQTVKATAIAPHGIAGRELLAQLVGSEVSILRRCLETRTVVRISNFHDANERFKITSTYEYDEDLEAQITALLDGEHVKSLIAAPIVADNHVVSIIALFNKQGYLPESFTTTDIEIVNSVCKFLSGVIPSIEMPRVMERLSRVFSKVDLENESERRTLFETLTQIIPSVSAAALGLKNWGATQFEQIHIGGANNILSEILLRLQRRFSD